MNIISGTTEPLTINHAVRRIVEQEEAIAESCRCWVERERTITVSCELWFRQTNTLMKQANDSFIAKIEDLRPVLPAVPAQQGAPTSISISSAQAAAQPAKSIILLVFAAPPDDTTK